MKLGGMTPEERRAATKRAGARLAAELAQPHVKAAIAAVLQTVDVIDRAKAGSRPATGLAAAPTTSGPTDPEKTRQSPGNRGGAGRGQGRKRLEPHLRLGVVSVRLSAADAAKLESLGGAAWIRQQLAGV